MKFEFGTDSEGMSYFITNGWQFQIDVLYNSYPNHILVMIDTGNHKHNMHFDPMYLFAYVKDTHEIVWDYDVMYLGHGFKEKDVDRPILDRSETNHNSILVRLEDGYYTKPQGGDEDPTVRENIEIFIRDNEEDFNEALNTLLAESMLD